jgi:hypothetical protein
MRYGVSRDHQPSRTTRLVKPKITGFACWVFTHVQIVIPSFLATIGTGPL